MNALSWSHASRSWPERPLDLDLRGDLETCRDIVLDRLAKHLSSAQIVESACVAGFCKSCNTVYDSLHILVETARLPDASYLKLV
jgi:hypothetical protein